VILARLISAVVFVAIFVTHALYAGACATSAPSGWTDFGISSHVVVLTPGSRLPAPGSRLLGSLAPWLLAPGSWLLAPGSWLLAAGSLAPDSWLLAPGSWLLAPGSWLLAPGSWLLAPWRRPLGLLARTGLFHRFFLSVGCGVRDVVAQPQRPLSSRKDRYGGSRCRRVDTFGSAYGRRLFSNRLLWFTDACRLPELLRRQSLGLRETINGVGDPFFRQLWLLVSFVPFRARKRLHRLSRS
jgi:hypothetical protein